MLYAGIYDNCVCMRYRQGWTGTLRGEKNKDVVEEVKEEVKQSPEQTEEDVSDEELDATAGGGKVGVTDRNRIDD